MYTVSGLRISLVVNSKAIFDESKLHPTPPIFEAGRGGGCPAARATDRAARMQHSQIYDFQQRLLFFHYIFVRPGREGSPGEKLLAKSTLVVS